MKRILLGSTFLLISSACLAGTGSWGYSKTNGPATWGQNYPLCGKGQQQSPLNINPAKVQQTKLPGLSLKLNKTALTLVNNGYTVMGDQLTSHNSFSLGGTIYNIVQFHFHHPSETTINGKHFPLELHFVGQSRTGKFAVLAVLYRQGPANPVLTQLWQSMPMKPGQKNQLNGAYSLQQLLPQSSRYYTYPGSLTTPPCTEGIRWNVLTQPMTASAQQITQFAKAYPYNSRPVQSPDGRVIKESATKNE